MNHYGIIWDIFVYHDIFYFILTDIVKYLENIMRYYDTLLYIIMV